MYSIYFKYDLTNNLIIIFDIYHNETVHRRGASKLLLSYSGDRSNG